MTNFMSVQFDADGNEVEPAQTNVQAERPTEVGYGAQVRDVSADNAHARAVLNRIRDPQATQRLSDDFETKRARFEELEDNIAALEAAGRQAPQHVREERERVRHDLMIMHARLQSAVGE